MVVISGSQHSSTMPIHSSSWGSEVCCLFHLHIMFSLEMNTTYNDKPCSLFMKHDPQYQQNNQYHVGQTEVIHFTFMSLPQAEFLIFAIFKINFKMLLVCFLQFDVYVSNSFFVFVFCRDRPAGEDASFGWRREAHCRTRSGAPILRQPEGTR